MHRSAATLRGAWSRLSLRPTTDTALVTALLLFVILTLPFVDRSRGLDRPVGLPAVALVVAAGVATMLRHRWPAPALLAASAATALYLTIGYPYGPVFAFVVVPVYAAARRLPLRLAGSLAVASYLMLLVHLLTNDAAIPGLLGALPAAAWVAIPFTVGAASRAVAAARQREHDAAARQLIDAERLRLSQEVHDIVGHGLAAIQMQADIALHVRDQRPEQARAALAAISKASGHALDELRETLRAIHPVGESTRAHAPTPGLARVQELCDVVADAGVEVDLTVVGTQRPLPTAADVAAYRVLQESLTNVVKHSAHPRAEVRIEHTDDAVTLEVTNQALTMAVSPGVGITGMQRRVTSVGGTFSAGPGAEAATFRVRARIPRDPPEES